tara:strand:- start:1965 stop:3743 length:1779 start_codon:yes stop_codon:yes gene_type:complete
MSNLSDFFGASGGGAKYTPSTATAGIAVVAGASYRLSSDSTMYPATSSILPEAAGASNAMYGTDATHYSYFPDAYIGDKFLPDGRSFVWYGSNTGQVVNIALSKDGATRANTYALTLFGGFSQSMDVYQKNIGETATHYLNAFRLSFYNTSAQLAQHSGILKVSKTDDTFTVSTGNNVLNGGTGSTSNAGWGYRGKHGGNQHTCRGNSVYVDVIFTSTAAARIVAQEFSPTTGNFTGTGGYGGMTAYDTKKPQLLKMDDATGTFLCFIPTSSSNLRVYKAVVGATGSVTMTTLQNYTNSSTEFTLTKYLSAFYGGGAGSNNIFATYSSSSSNMQTQVATYDISDDSITWQAAVTKTYIEGNTYGQTSGNWNNFTYEINRTYDPVNKLFYNIGVDAGGPGIIYDVNTGEYVSNKLAETLKGSSQGYHRGINYSDGILNMVDKTDYMNGAAWYAFEFSGFLITTGAVAVATSSAASGGAVNIVLRDGVESTVTLPATHFLSKNDFYFDYKIASETAAVSSVIKSIQRGVVSPSGNQNITIGAVDLAKSFIRYGHFNTSTSYQNMGRCYLTGPTTLYWNHQTGTNHLEWEVIEYV